MTNMNSNLPLIPLTLEGKDSMIASLYEENKAL